MIIPLNLNCLSIQDQKAIYQALKNKFENFPYKAEPIPQGEELLNMEIADIQWISVRLCNLLILAKIRTIRDLTETTKKYLQALHGFGPRSLAEVEEILS